MQGTSVVILVLSLFGVFYAYAGYPLFLFCLSFSLKHPLLKNNYRPFVSIIITAYNEEMRIRLKLENTLAVDYPKELLQIIVASDGSTDRTNSIVREFSETGIDLLIVKDRKGKENAQSEALQKAKGEIIVFTDVSTLLETNAVGTIVDNFADKSIGCVSGMDKVISEDENGAGGGEGAYVRYEMWIRELESKVNTVVGLSGSFFAARKEVCRDFSKNMDSDFRTLLNSRKAGMRGIVDPEAIGCYKAVDDTSKEFSRKIRTVVRGLTVFFNSLEFCNFFTYKLFSIQYVSHKLFKWLVPFFLVVALISNAILVQKSAFFLCLFCSQIIFYCVAAIPFLLRTRENPIFIKLPHFFVSVNLAIAIAWLKFLRGERIIVWQPSDRK